MADKSKMNMVGWNQWRSWTIETTQHPINLGKRKKWLKGRLGFQEMGREKENEKRVERFVFQEALRKKKR